MKRKQPQLDLHVIRVMTLTAKKQTVTGAASKPKQEEELKTSSAW